MHDNHPLYWRFTSIYFTIYKRCRLPKQMGAIKQSNRRSSLSHTYKDKRKISTWDNMKTVFSKVVFTEELKNTR